MKTYQEIISELISLSRKKIPQITNYRVGGVFRGILEVIAVFLEKIYQEMDSIFENRFLHTSKGIYLEEKAQELGLDRREARKTTGYVRLFREEAGRQLVINSNQIFATKDGLRFYSIEEQTLLEGQQQIDVLVQAEYEGKSYNVFSHQIVEILSPIAGIDSVTNEDNWIREFGLDVESDTELRVRALSQWKGIGGATTGAYEIWARECSDVSHVKVIPCLRGVGTVDVVVLGRNQVSLSEEKMDEVHSIIEKYRPIGVDVLVRSPFEVVIPVHVRVSVSQISVGLKEELELRVKEYFAGLGMGKDFEPSALVWKLFSCEGIESVEILTDKTTISEIQIAKLGELTLEINLGEGNVSRII